MQESRAELLVIGGGPGGYAAAFAAADLGLSVTLVDPAKNPGGVCLYEGCIPSKALLHAAGVLREAREAARIGIAFADPAVDLERLRAWKRGVVDRLTGGLGTLTRQRKVTYVQGSAVFRDRSSALVKEASGGERAISFGHAIVATGSRPLFPPGFPQGGGRIMDAGAALDLPDVPSRLLVVGGGYIGCEMATIYSALGARVTLVELTGSLLPGMDGDLVRVLAPRLAAGLEAVRLGTRVISLEQRGEVVRVRLEQDGRTTEAEFDRVLVAVGRVPRTGSIGLERAGVTLTPAGYVAVDEERRTTNPAVFAIGDVTGQPLLAHKASREGKVAVHVIAGVSDRYMPLAIPAVVYTDPEIAWAGLTEAEAAAQGRTVKVATFPWSASGRAVTIDRAEGLTKLVVDARNGQVLGVGIVGRGAGDLIVEGVAAIEMQATTADLALMIHPHPTCSETILEAAEAADGRATHYFGRR